MEFRGGSEKEKLSDKVINIININNNLLPCTRPWLLCSSSWGMKRYDQ